jgi:ABC-2 type transport system ATP-binding protein
MIEIANLRKEYREVLAVKALNLTVPNGEVYGLIGPNGAGKTTTIRIACGLLTPTSGEVRINGVDVHRDPEEAQSFIGYLSDFFSVYEDLKVWEYLDYFAHAYKLPPEEIPKRIDEVISNVGLEVKRDALIKGLSRGMKQRLGIARAIIHRPKVLLLDEPASGLDPKARIDLRNLLLAFQSEGATVVISSHILSELEGFCTSVGVMERGVLIRSGRIEELTAAESPLRVVRVTWVGNPMAREILSMMPGIIDIQITGTEASFKFSGSDEDLVRLHSRLTTAGLPVLSFGEVKQTVEDLYLKLSHDEVM